MDRRRPRLVQGGGEDRLADVRVQAVLEVLAGDGVPVVARRWSVDVALLHRWVRAFVDAGAAQVTNRPREDEALRRDRFLAAFAHETRTPLTVAQGWVTMLEDEDLPPPMVQRTAGKLRTSLGRLAERARDVELMAAASLGRLQATRAPVTVGELVATLDPVPEVDEATAATVLHVDRELFATMLRDLWREAWNARPVPRSVSLHVAATSPWDEVRVVRDADPVDPQVLQALFEPFDLNDDATGITLGLYLARALAVAHGGTVGLDQDEDGAVFWVRVPERRSRSRT